MIKSRSSDETKRYTSPCPLVGNFEETIEVQEQGNIESLCTVISRDIASSSSSVKRSNDPTHHLVPLINQQSSEMRRRKSGQSIERNREQFNFHSSDHTTMTTANKYTNQSINNERIKDKKKYKRKPIKSQGNPSIDSIPFRLNSVSSIDKASRILFPIAFAIINYFYWHTFMLQDDDTDTRVH